MLLFSNQRAITSILLLLTSLQIVHGACNDALGLESGEIQNSQMTASENYYTVYKAQTARLNNRYGLFLGSSGSYLKIDFLQYKTISGLAVQGASNRRIKLFWLFYSIDGRIWETYRDRSGSQDVTVTATSPNQIVRIVLDSHITARYIAINPRSSYAGIRLEVYGCSAGNVTERPPTTIVKDIDSNAVWTPSGSPYLIKSMITVRPSSQVGIQPGVRVIFEGQNAGLLIRGSLIASGIHGFPVCFWSTAVPTQSTTAWEGLTVEPSGRFYCNYCEMRHAKVGVSGPTDSLSLNTTKLYQNKNGMHLTNSGTKTRTFHNLEVTQNSNRGIAVTENWISSSRVVIRDSTLDRNKNAFVFLSSCDIDIENCIVTNNRETGVWFGASISLTIKDSIFKGNKDGAIEQRSFGNISIHASLFEDSNTGLSLGSGGDITVHGSTFRNHRYSGISGYRRSNSVFDISMSRFESSAKGIDVSVYTSGKSHIHIADSTFLDLSDFGVDIVSERVSTSLENNTFSGSSELPQAYPFAVSLNNKWAHHAVSLIVKNNLVTQFGKQSYLSAPPYYEDKVDEPSVYISENTFENLSGSHTLTVNAVIAQIANNTFRNSSHQSTLHISSVNTVINRNVFENPESQYDITTDVLYTENNAIDAKYNYFGSTDKKYLRSRVNDIYQNLSKVEITIDPFYTSSSLESTDSGTEDFSIGDLTDAGGKLQGDVLIPRNKKLFIKRTVIIPNGLALTVEPGVTLTFEEDQGIIVQGKLKLSGSEEGNIILKNGTRMKWGGVVTRDGELELRNVRLEAAKIIGNLRSSNCSSYSSVLISHSMVQADYLDLSSGMFNLNISNARLTSPTLKFEFSDCGNNNETDRERSFVLNRAKIAANTFKVVVKRSSTDVPGIVIRESELSGTEEFPDVDGSNITLTFDLGEHDNLTLRQNIFKGGKTEVTSDDYSTENISITDNIFNGCSLELGTPYITLARNIFENSLSYAVKFIKKYFKDHVIDASYNYWGTEKFLEIRAQVYDKTNDVDLPKIEVVPFFQNRRMTKLVETVSFIGENNTIGGNVEGSVALTRSHSPYTVISMIYVGKRHTLSIDAGVTLLFKEDTGIMVEGSLLVSGTADLPVLFHSANPGLRWQGVLLKGHKGSARLIGGKDSREGNVEIRVNDRYGTVCLGGFDERDAEVVCRMAGFDPSGGVTVYTGREAKTLFGGSFSLGPPLYNNLACFGNESHVDDCQGDSEMSTYRETDDCPFLENAAIRCHGDALRGDIPDPEIRLEHLELNDTSSGISLSGNITRISHIKSQHSRTTGITIHMEFLSEYAHELDNIESSDNGLHGIAVDGMNKYSIISISTCKLSNNKLYGLIATGQATVFLKLCEISQNEVGVYSSEYVFLNISIRESRINTNKAHALKLEQSKYETHELHLKILDSHISQHDTRYKSYSWYRTFSYRNIISLEGRNLKTGEVQLKGNVFEDNLGNCIFCSYNWIDTVVTTLVTNNSFINNRGRILEINGPSVAKHSVSFTWNEVIDNRVTSTKDSLLRVRLSDSTSELNIHGNTILNNQASKIIEIQKNVYNLLSQCSITNNSLTQNQAEHALFVDLYNIDIHHNIFTNPRAVCELKVPVFKAGREFNATWNYWGFENVSQIMTRICGFDIDMNLAFVRYLPSLISNTSFSETPERHIDFFLPGAVGGVVEEDVLLDNVDLPYVIERSIMIRESGRVVLHGGSRILFKENRGLYSFGNVETVMSTKEVLLTGEMDEDWFGLEFNQRADLSLSNVNVSGPRNGLVLNTKNVVLSKCIIKNSKTSGVTLKSNVSMVDMRESVIEKNKGNGVYVEAPSVVLQNGEVGNNAEHGVRFSKTNSAVVKNMNVHNNGYSGIFVNHGSSSRFDVVITNCRLHNHADGRALYIDSKRYINNLKNVSVTSCTFDSNPKGSVYIDIDYDQHIIDLKGNKFLNYAGVVMDVYSTSNISIRENSFINITESDSNPGCLVYLEFNDNRQQPQQILNIYSNNMKNISGKCAVSMKSSVQPEGGFLYNEVSQSSFTEGTILLDLANYTLTQNILDNPDSDFEIKVLKTGSGYINATNNWWGTTNPQIIADRILDKADDPTLLNVIYEPALKGRDFDCSLVKNCSGRGECIRPNGCECISGWKGKSCDEFDCSEFSDCNGGRCVGPSKCECNYGWIGTSCAVATCYGVSNCSERGFCTEPDTCACLSQYRGAACERCAPNRWGPHCVACPRCVHGTCNQDTGVCVCDGDNWNGTLCDRCSRYFYGVDCLALTTVLKVSPDAGADIGGTLVHVRGDNFNISKTNDYKCKFGSVIVNATRISNHHFTCVTPKLSPRTVTVEISSDGKEFTNNKVQFTFVAECLETTCGSTADPPHGQCIFGKCACNLPWIGETCSVEIIAPVVETILDKEVSEGQVYREKMTLSQGTSVIRWSLLESPDGMEIDRDSGELIWSRTVGSSSPYVVSVRAENAAGHHVIVWFLTVPLSYRVIVDDLNPSGILPYPTEITITGHLNATARNFNMTSPKVKILIQNSGVTRELTTHTDTEMGFHITFIPRPDDKGEFSVSANHPSDKKFVEQTSWRILNIVCEPNEVYLTKYLDVDTVTFEEVAKLTNAGIDPVENILVQFKTYSYEVNSATVRFASSNESSIPLLAPNDSVPFDVTIIQDLPIRTDLYIVFRSELGTRAVLKVKLNLKVRQPTLQLVPATVKRSVVIGKQTIINVNITNSGEALAENIEVDTIKDPNLALVSISGTTMSSEKVDLAPGDTGTISFVYTVPSEMPLGVISDSVLIKAKDAASMLNLKLYVTSDERFDIQVYVEDEYTYFAADKPLLAGAKVTLKNSRRGVIYSLVTNERGSVTMKGVYADQYTLEAEAANHTSESLIIVVDGSRNSYPVFLQRQAVTYTWSVTKTTFEDTYRITLESTFETRVPMPVVTIEPAKVNLFPYEEGRKTKLVFLITNHGYIRADNLRFSLPNHPSLRFIQMVDPIGDLDANTSIVVPFKIERKVISKRAVAGCGMLLLYDYVCGSTKTAGAGVALTSEPPNMPPEPCGGGGGSLYGNSAGGGDLRGVFGSFVGSNIPCDCLKAYMNSCVKPLLRLPFELVPGLGCALDIYDIANTDSSTSAVSMATTAASTLLDCGLGLSCSICVPLFKFLNCADGLERGCRRDKRRKREVNSELVLEVTRARDHFNNYLNLTQELMGNLSVIDVKGKWKTRFFKGVSEKSPLQYLLSQSEVNSTLHMVDKDDVTVVRDYLERWNNTFSAWQSGATLPDNANVMSIERFRNLFDAYVANTKYVKERGFSTIFKHFEYTITEYGKSLKEEKPEEGICARVRIRISQDLVLTRDAFQARLEIENGENAALNDIDVEIFITKTAGNSSTDNHLFSVGKPNLEGISSVSGNGSLAPGVEGSAEWLIVPYNGAAVEEDVEYDVGGILSYTLEGREFSVPLLSDTITVSPNPSLTLAYFHEKYVQGNDPFTDVMEKSVPFSLSVMVTNKGDGVARQVRITSGQPEIIENEKGLLVAFKIISAQLGNAPIQPSLTVDFGDIYRHQTKTARWFMTSTLKGRFYNYSATFENINPLGDPELSIFESISYHDMVHLVRIDDSGADSLDDFLVNDVIDKDNLPDRLYDSSNGFYTYLVDAVPPVSFSKIKEETKGSKRYTFVRVVVPRGNESWRYSRIVNNITRDVESEPLLQVVRDDEKNILIPQNSWLTNYYDNKFYFHLFDENIRDKSESTYTAVFGQKNLYPPTFTNASYYIETEVIPESQDLIALQATDIDGDDIFFMVEGNETLFSVDESSGMVRNTLPLIENGTFIVTVSAVDSGVPAKSSSVTIKVVVTSSAATGDVSSSTDGVVTQPTRYTTTTPKTSGSNVRCENISLVISVFNLVLLIFFK